MFQTALAALLAIHGAGLRTPGVRPAIVGLSNAELARTIKTDLESISGSGTVSVSIVGESHTSDAHTGDTHIGVRIAISSFSPKICADIYAREQGLHQLFPGLNFDFSFSGPELARAIKSDIESISGRGSVDVSIDSQTLFNVRIAVPGYSSEIYSQLYDRELDFYRAFPDLSFDFYLRPDQN